MRKNIVIALCLFLLSGCASVLNIGHETFKCEKTGENGRCGDPIAIYKNKDKILRDANSKKLENKEDSVLSTNADKEPVKLVFKDAISKPSGDPPVPVRQAEEIARVFINGFKDHKGNLIGNIWASIVVNDGDWLSLDGRRIVNVK